MFIPKLDDLAQPARSTIERTAATTDWHVAFSAALLNESGEAAERMELAAAEFEESPATLAIANILRDRAEDIRRALNQNEKP